jgi:hypothetical protein
MDIRQKHAKRILKQYGKNLKAAEKRGPLLSVFKCFWIDTQDLEEIAQKGVA